MHLSLMPLEAHVLRRAVLRLPTRIREEVTARARARQSLPILDSEGPCPLLVDARCTVYPDRPLTCRVQGLPMVFCGEASHAEYTVCPLNFQDGPPPGDDLLRLDVLDLKLAAVNAVWCQATGAQPETRIPLAAAVLGEGLLDRRGGSGIK